MANTYAKIKSSTHYEGNEKFGFKSYSTEMKLSLTAFIGGDKHTQLTVQTNSTSPDQSGTGYITLGDKEVDLLIAALLERKLGKITATGYEQSAYCPDEEEL